MDKDGDKNHNEDKDTSDKILKTTATPMRPKIVKNLHSTQRFQANCSLFLQTLYSRENMLLLA